MGFKASLATPRCRPCQACAPFLLLSEADFRFNLCLLDLCSPLCSLTFL